MGLQPLSAYQRAIKYLGLYFTTKNKTTSYQEAFTCSYDHANSKASEYHMSPVVRDAFDNVVKESLVDVDTKDKLAKIVHECLDKVDDHKDKATIALQLAKLMGYTDKASSIQVTQVQATQALTAEQEQAIINRINNLTPLDE